ncbi:hypothetical protein [Brevibacterium sp. SMBL_HHYL_HB1]|uniref:hypothetical protein n=1 Tax=Brevibacterium sp. SMBL_HHYL_HB1 TaxID=2777556 RepID=UPI001BA90CD2|nr:hypothetical protein [Brevibacterium sp. SMBL_HHYL_HB1]QUL80651.1 hypothetical protein IG171_07805 [Brevibacterium sp. SMBL_HHYL_HB1]
MGNRTPSIKPRTNHIVCPTEDPLIVDLFAGSGSTGDAVVSMNRADGGSRRCLLLSMNEVPVRKRRELTAAGLAEGDEDFEAWGMFRRTLMPRLQAVGGDWRFVLER